MFILFYIVCLSLSGLMKNTRFVVYAVPKNRTTIIIIIMMYNLKGERVMEIT